MNGLFFAPSLSLPKRERKWRRYSHSYLQNENDSDFLMKNVKPVIRKISSL